MAEPGGLLVAAPRSGSGKTVVTLGLLAALKARGLAVAPAKSGPDYIDTAILERAAGRAAVNLDPWAMAPSRLKSLAASHTADADLLLVEGVMGLFDGAADGTGSTGDLAAALGLPLVLVVDAERQGQSIAALVSGFANWRADIRVAGVILNRVASTRHERMLVAALSETGITCLGVIPRDSGLALPERHLGLVLPDEATSFETVVGRAGEVVADYVDLGRVLELAAPLASAEPRPLRLAPLGQRIAIARDRAFAFLYRHMLDDWRAAGAELSFFSPLADEAPAPDADAVFLPGGYPELHGSALSAASNFRAGLLAARDRGALVYGECGGFMVLGEVLFDKAGVPHEMVGLLPVITRIDRPKRTLGYRRLAHQSPLPWPGRLMGHEFHYSSVKQTRLTPLFAATDTLGEPLPPMGAVEGRVMGSYAHVIDAPAMA
ncbi:hydrogenobyrinate a,c-diamide synthase [Devosia nitrariae]|uniref:Hydrogenobyrinate a,c-diamide synthase n=1 Tax=Devosia nitrariae TaxID=2071872 RepID=A0ABQ5VYV6_9HYPH|nr:hydrogenobyrinate a,c-diamide synthase [Devosia nitrariae]